MNCPGKTLLNRSTLTKLFIFMLLLSLLYLSYTNLPFLKDKLEGVKVYLNLTSKQKRWEYKYKQFARNPE